MKRSILTAGAPPVLEARLSESVSCVEGQPHVYMCEMRVVSKTGTTVAMGKVPIRTDDPRWFIMGAQRVTLDLIAEGDVESIEFELPPHPDPSAPPRAFMEMRSGFAHVGCQIHLNFKPYHRLMWKPEGGLCEAP